MARDIRQTAVSALAAALALLTPTGGGAVVLDGRPARDPRSMPFRLVEGFLIVVNGSIGGLHDLTMVVDTGTTRTVVDERVAGLLAGLKGRDDALHVFGEDVATSVVTVPSLEVGPILQADLPVLTADLGSFRQRFGLRLDALLGLDVLRDRCLTIDYVTAVISFACAGRWATSVPLDADSPYPVVSASIDGARYRLLVDSGSEAIVLFNKAVPAGTDIRALPEVSGTDLTGTRRLRALSSRRLSIGRQFLAEPPVFVMNAGEKLGFDGVFGTRWLPGRQVLFDFPRRVLGWR
jgi:predicted aspartyl protease